MTEENREQKAIDDLVKKVERGETTPREAKAEVMKMGLHHQKYEYKYRKIIFPCMILGCFLCLLPFIAAKTGVRELSFLAKLPSIDFPLVVKIGVSVFFVILFAIGMHAIRLRTNKGGTRDEDEPIIFIREGPYAVMRHPTDLPLGFILLWFTIGASALFPFTILSIAGNILFFVGNYFITVGEEELNVLKWGDKYRSYQNEVPRFNFVVGIYRWARRRGS